MSRRWGTTQNFCLVFINELEKQLFTKTTVQVSQKTNKKFSIYAVVFLKKKQKEKHLEISSFYTCIPKLLMT